MKKCSIPGCDLPFLAKGLCRVHYWRQKYLGTTELKPKEPRKKCSVEGCESFSLSLGYCHKHYTRMRRNGTLEIQNFNEQWKIKQGESQKTDLSKMDPMPDPRPGRRGTYANNIVNEIKSRARGRGIEWNLSAIETYKLITGPCEYCGEKPDWPRTRNGIDRQLCALGYVSSNCVSSCSTCNNAKAQLSVDQFKEWICRVYQHLHQQHAV